MPAATRSAMLWCCLHFPGLPLRVFPRLGDSRDPAVCVDPARRGLILACNPAAAERGIVPGTSVLAAHGLCPELQVVRRETAREAAWLEGAGFWAMRFTPTVSLAPPDSLLLEIGGCLAYFGGIDTLFSGLRAALLERGGRTLVATAPTPSAALMLARAGREVVLADPTRLRECLDAMPVVLLECDEAAIEALRSMGIETLGECRGLPRAGLARRFGQRWLDIVDRCYGDAVDARPAMTLPHEFRRRIELPGTTDDAEALSFAARRIVQEACGWLQGHGAGATRLLLSLHHEDKGSTRLVVGLRPSRDVSHIMAVVREHLVRRSLEAPVDELELEVSERVPLIARNLELRLSAGGEARQSIDRLLDRLRARLGDSAVVGLSARADHRPESAWGVCDPGLAAEFPSPPGGTPRPLWLLPEPVLLARSIGDSIERVLQGPERIESGWWDGGDVARDYYVVLTPQGMRWWIFHQRGERRWFLQGLFG